MKQTTQKQLRSLINRGIAKDLNEEKGGDYTFGLHQIQYSKGKHGINGALLQDKDGKLYAIVGRTSKLLQYV